MSTVANVVSRQPLYTGRGFPIDSLSPDEFEEFVFGCLLCIGDLLGLTLIGKPSGSGDGGFDIQAEVLTSRRLACIQCKRLKSPLGTHQVTEELAKVAATAALESSDVGEHRFICTGGVRNKLVQQLREESRQELALEAGERLANALDGELSSLRERLERVGEDPRQVAESYVQGLDLLTVWDFDEFDAALSPRWSAVLQVAERYFQIATVVREHPRATFDRATYIAEHRNFTVAFEPRLTNASLPNRLATSSAANPCAPDTSAQRSVTTMRELMDVKLGELVVLIGDGGSGKSTALKILRAELLRTKPESTLPILVSLATYVPGELDRAIHQELGVDHGTWRSLPDQVVLLCDGLNECPATKVGTFLDEIKVLLKRSRVACVLSTRESTRHSKIVLPQEPIACTKIEGITPIAVRRIAEHELRGGNAEAFVTAYRSLADRSFSPLLWTPFAVQVALRVWRLNAALPPTLGEMLDELLRAKCARDAESLEDPLEADVILGLAGAFAFQCLVVDRRLECPVLEAGKCVREAKRYCADALGITDLTEKKAVELLIRHEFLSASTSGHLGFGHQLLAGALAAQVLSRVWQSHTESLNDPVTDDAWVFAARMIQPEHAIGFLETTFNTELMLGARTARELPVEFLVHAEELLTRSVAPTSPEIVQVQGLFAFARLGSSGALDKLRELAREPDSKTYYTVQQALASAGDTEFLKEILSEVEKLKSTPFKVSGGCIGIWESTPVPIRLDLARHYLCNSPPGHSVTESLSLVACERDPHDAEIIERHLRAAKHLGAWQIALYALNQVLPNRAKEYLATALTDVSTPADRARIIRAASHIGMDVDVRMAFECATSDLPSTEEYPESHYVLTELISDVLAKSAFPPDLIAFVENELPGSSGERRGRLWQIATSCKSLPIAHYAAKCIEEWGADLGYACNYFIGQSEWAHSQREQLIHALGVGLAKESTWFSWGVSRAFALVGKLGFSAQIAEQLSAMVERLTRVRRAVETDDIPSLLPSDAEILATTKQEHITHHIETLVAPLIPAAASARLFLSEDVLLSLLYFDTSMYGVVDDLRDALSDVTDAAIDQALLQIEKNRTSLHGLVVACARGPSQVRVEMLARQLQHYYCIPMGLTLLCKAIESCWCKAICRMVVRTVAEIPQWSADTENFFWDFANMVGRNVGPDDLGDIKIELSRARTSFAQRILGIWYDLASGERVGLARIPSEI